MDATTESGSPPTNNSSHDLSNPLEFFSRPVISVGNPRIWQGAVHLNPPQKGGETNGNGKSNRIVELGGSD